MMLFMLTKFEVMKRLKILKTYKVSCRKYEWKYSSSLNKYNDRLIPELLTT